jgi:hypothetical protein
MASYVLLCLATLQGVRAWGALGHATIAYVAQNYVTAETASWAQGVLNDTSASYLASIASFADQFRATAAGAWSGELAGTACGLSVMEADLPPSPPPLH